MSAKKLEVSLSSIEAEVVGSTVTVVDVGGVLPLLSVDFGKLGVGVVVDVGRTLHTVE